MTKEMLLGLLKRTMCVLKLMWVAETWRKSETFGGLQWIAILSAGAADMSQKCSSVIALSLRMVQLGLMDRPAPLTSL